MGTPVSAEAQELLVSLYEQQGREWWCDLRRIIFFDELLSLFPLFVVWVVA